MGFYGNITNNVRSNFTFDKIYSNRYAMDSANTREDSDGKKISDGVYIGRYVLVEYDKEASNIIKVKNLSNIPNSTLAVYYLVEEDNTLYKNIKQSDGTYIQEKIIEITDTTDIYAQNFIIDKNNYSITDRGYDSTVWQKTRIDNEEKYIQVAELNTIVPTFDLSIDAPTEAPVKPYYDEESTNIYYKQHIQPSWGFRVRPADNYQEFDSNGEEFYITDTIPADIDTDETIYKTKLDSTGNTLYYYPDTKKWSLSKPESKNYKCAIYYNEAGFSETSEVLRTDIDNKIEVSNTGYSGNKYDEKLKPDIQELSIMLPGIGNTLAKIWNLVYGKGTGNFKMRNTDIAWEDASSKQKRAGLRLNDDVNGYNTNSVNTLAGCINTAHDLIGMVIKNSAGLPNENTANNDYIYYNMVDKKYYYKKQLAPNEEGALKELQNNDFYYEVSVVDLPDDIWHKEYSGVSGKYNYIKENKFNGYRDYVTITSTPIALSSQDFIPSEWYREGVFVEENINEFKSGVNYYVFDDEVLYDYKLVSGNFDENETYYIKVDGYSRCNDYVDKNNTKFFGIISNDSTAKPIFKANYYAYFNEDETKLNTVTSDTELDLNKTYYPSANSGSVTWILVDGAIVKSDIINYSDYIKLIQDGYINGYKGSDFAVYDNNKKYYVKINNNDYAEIVFDKNSNEPYSYYPGMTYYENLTATEKTNDSYSENMYYYKNSNGDFILDTNSTKTDNIQYYTNIEENNCYENINKEKPYYLFNDNILYISSNGKKVINTGEYSSTTTYYKNAEGEAYVVSDTNYNYPTGYLWPNGMSIPESGTILGYRIEKYKWEELSDFSKTVNTLNGLILKINQIIDLGNVNTYDLDTVQGALNYLKTTLKGLYQNYVLPAQEALTAIILSETNVKTYAENASTSASNAATSASNASTSETNAKTYAENASISASNAATSASNASTSETNAKTYAENASTSASNAAEEAVESALNAYTWLSYINLS